jgi:hypothetical protein
VCGTDLEGAGGELDADGGLGLEAELVAGEAGEDVGLADAGVADEDDLEEVVVLVVHPVRHRQPPRILRHATHAKIHQMRRGRDARRIDRIGSRELRVRTSDSTRLVDGMDRLGAGGRGGQRWVGGAGERATTMREREETEQNVGVGRGKGGMVTGNYVMIERAKAKT